MRFHLLDKFKFMWKCNAVARPITNGIKIIIIIYEKTIFNIELKSIQQQQQLALKMLQL